MDALILSCGTGGGHNAAAAALAAALSERGHGVQRLNPYALGGKYTARAVDAAYVRLVQRAPAAFGAIYSLGDAYRRLPVRSPVYYANRHTGRQMRDYLLAHPVDVVVMTHLFPAEMLTALRRAGQTLPKTVFVATDYACTPFTEETDCDCYVLPTPELVEEFAARGLPRDRLAPLGIPVHPAFTRPGDRTAARERLSLPQNKRVILLSGGSMGAGRMAEAVGLLRRRYPPAEAEVVVLCGSNRRLRERLLALPTGFCRPVAHTDCMADYLAACDVYFTKPGGLSTTEAAACGCALGLLSPIPGCESRNLRYFCERGMALSAAPAEQNLLAACEALLRPGAAEQMRRCQREGLPQNAAAEIARLLERLCEGESGAP